MLKMPSKRSTVSRLSWPIYALILCALAAVLYAHVGEHMLDTHTMLVTLQIAKRVYAIPPIFLLPKSGCPGVPSLNCCYCFSMPSGEMIRAYFTVLALCCM